jgi:CDP-4-dehydro-6-deoxyglucose reductase
MNSPSISAASHRVRVDCGPETSTFDATEQAPILDQALEKGLPVPFGCKRGDCGDCAAQLLEGEIEAAEPLRPLRRAADILLCNAIAHSDLHLQLPYAAETAHIKPLRTPCKISTIQKLAEDVIEVVLRLPPTCPFDFVAGQYIRLTNRAGIARSYSLAAPPQADKQLRIQVRRVPGGEFSRYLFNDAQAGDLLQLEGPKGLFVLRKKMRVEKTIFLATGTGIAPVQAILSGLAEGDKSACGTIFIYWGNRRASDAYCSDALSRIAVTLNARLTLVNSRESTADRGDTGTSPPRHVQDAMLRDHRRLDSTQVFASGNSEMIESARRLCVSSGLPEDRFFSDAFTAS